MSIGEFLVLGERTFRCGFSFLSRTVSRQAKFNGLVFSFLFLRQHCHTFLLARNSLSGKGESLAMAESLKSCAMPSVVLVLASLSRWTLRDKTA